MLSGVNVNCKKVYVDFFSLLNLKFELHSNKFNLLINQKQQKNKSKVKVKLQIQQSVLS